MTMIHTCIVLALSLLLLSLIGLLFQVPSLILLVTAQQAPLAQEYGDNHFSVLSSRLPVAEVSLFQDMAGVDALNRFNASVSVAVVYGGITPGKLKFSPPPPPPLDSFTSLFVFMFHLLCIGAQMFCYFCQMSIFLLLSDHV